MAMNTGVQSLLVAIVQDQDADQALRALTRAGLRATRISSTGNFLDRGNVTLLLGLEHHAVQQALDLLAENCHRRTTFINAAPPLANPTAPGLITPLEVEIGGAITMLLAVEQFVRIMPGTSGQLAETVVAEQDGNRMKLVVAIVSAESVSRTLNALTRCHYSATRISTTGGFLRKGNATLIIGINAAQVHDVLKCIEGTCAALPPSKNQEQACATIFVLDVEQQSHL